MEVEDKMDGVKSMRVRVVRDGRCSTNDGRRQGRMKEFYLWSHLEGIKQETKIKKSLVRNVYRNTSSSSLIVTVKGNRMKGSVRIMVLATLAAFPLSCYLIIHMFT